MTRPIAVLLALALLALLSPAQSARADDVADARFHFRKGAELYRLKRWREAIVEFEAAYRVKPHGAIHFNVAQCRERLEEWPSALRSYQDYLREVPDARDRAAVRATIGRLEARLAAAGVQALLVYSEPPGAEVRVDGKPRGKTPFHVVLPPGAYHLALSADGHAPTEEEVVLVSSSSTIVDLVLRPKTAAPSAASPATAAVAATPAVPSPVATATAPPVAPRPDLSAKPQLSPDSVPLSPPAVPAKEKRRVYTWVAAGTAAVAVAAGAYYGHAASQQSAKLRDGTVRTDAASLASGATSKARTANVLYAVAGAAGAAGVTLFFVEGRF
jgi:tetratricopeptide (TPR) repeat protein